MAEILLTYSEPAWKMSTRYASISTKHDHHFLVIQVSQPLDHLPQVSIFWWFLLPQIWSMTLPSPFCSFCPLCKSGANFFGGCKKGYDHNSSSLSFHELCFWISAFLVHAQLFAEKHSSKSVQPLIFGLKLFVFI